LSKFGGGGVVVAFAAGAEVGETTEGAEEGEETGVGGGVEEGAEETVGA
jgi:hypothetical protein